MIDPVALARRLMQQVPPQNAEVVDRGAMLPLGTYRNPDGSEMTTLAFPQPMRDGIDALAYALGQAQDPQAPQGYVTTDALNRGGQGLAESAMVGSLAATRPANSLGIFAGRKAKTADTEALAKALRMSEDGAPRESIWSDTGWFQGADGQWRFEIDDSGANINQFAPRGSAIVDASDNSVTPLRGGDWMNHRSLSEAYGEMPNVFYQETGGTDGFYGAIDGQPVIGLNKKYLDTLSERNTTDERRVGLHELQHFAQDKEGFARGASVANFDHKQFADGFHATTDAGIKKAKAEYEAAKRSVNKDVYSAIEHERALHDRLAATYGENWLWDAPGDVLDEAFKREQAVKSKLTDADTEALNKMRGLSGQIRALELQRNKKVPGPQSSAFNEWRKDQYLRTAGEVEARAVEARRDLTVGERRARPPWLDYDVPEGDVLMIARHLMQGGA